MKKNLLIVDDEPHLVGVLEFMLKGITGKIFSAESGKQAISILAENDIHCVLCDMNLPRMNGIEILREVRARDISVPFVFFTAEETTESLTEAAKLGAIDFLLKPHFQGLEKAVQAGLESLPYSPLPDSIYGKVLLKLSLDLDGNDP